MTITEQLGISVLQAPLAAVDRRALSQAWYSALYAHDLGAGACPAATKPANSTARTTTRAAAVAPHATSGTVRANVHALPRASAAKRTEGVVTAERRATRSPLARKIERAFARPQAPVRAASFALDGSAGRVRIVLRGAGARMHLIAICPAKARAQVAHALAQARYALAARGIVLDAQTRPAPC